MSYEHEPISPMFRIDVSAESESNQSGSGDRIVIELLRQMVASQQQQNRLIEELVQQNAAANKQTTTNKKNSIYMILKIRLN